MSLFPGEVELHAALASAALDAGELELAQACAQKAPGHHESLSALGMLALNAGDRLQARTYFDEALTRFPASGRSLLGRGVSLVLDADFAEAAKAVERGAMVFGDHVGSWALLGWIQLLAGDRARARTAFQKAIEVDGTFSEGHGGIAALDALEGDVASAERDAEAQCACCVGRRRSGRRNPAGTCPHFLASAA